MDGRRVTSLAHEGHVEQGVRSLYCQGCGTWPPADVPVRDLLHAKADLLARGDGWELDGQRYYTVRLTDVHEIIDEAFS